MPRVRIDENEKLSSKFSVAIKPETKRRLEVIAQIDGRSINAIVNQLTEDFCDSRADEIKEFDAFIASMRNRQQENSD